MPKTTLLQRYREREIVGKEKREKKDLKRRRNVIRAEYEPLFPAFFGILYRAMLLLPAVDLLAELAVRMRGQTDWIEFFSRWGWSAFAIWIVFGGAVILLCVCQLLRGRLTGYEEKQYRFAEEIPQEDRDSWTRTNREAGESERELWLYEGPPAIPLREKYGGYLKKALAEGMGLGALFVAAALIA